MFYIEMCIPDAESTQLGLEIEARRKLKRVVGVTAKGGEDGKAMDDISRPHCQSRPTVDPPRGNTRYRYH